MSSGDADVLSELLIAQLLDDDVQTMIGFQAAQKAQLAEIITDSAPGKGKAPQREESDEEMLCDDNDLAIQLFAETVRLSRDAALAQSLQHSHNASATADLQYAQQLVAADKKLLLDSEFARRLQEATDRGDNDIDTANFRDAESVLGPEVIEQLLAPDPNDKGKGKGKRRLSSPADEEELPRAKHQRTEHPSSPEVIVISDDECNDTDPLYPTCGICLETFRATHSPLKASASANSSSRLPFGLRLPCPGSHAYCLDCLSKHIRSKLDPNDDNSGNPETVVFPIRCPECSLTEWADGIPDEIAERILPQTDMVMWYHQKLLDSIPRYYCPNPRCSAIVEAHDDEDAPQATCPVCSTAICVPCKVLWHEGFSCEEYQALPEDERSPEDQQTLQLMKAQQWRRCPKCSFIIELTVGCYHMTCRCRTEFCFHCGSLWDVRRGRCSRGPACEFWDEEMLLDEAARRDEQALVRPFLPPAIPQVPRRSPSPRLVPMPRRPRRPPTLLNRPRAPPPPYAPGLVRRVPPPTAPFRPVTLPPPAGHSPFGFSTLAGAIRSAFATTNSTLAANAPANGMIPPVVPTPAAPLPGPSTPRAAATTATLWTFRPALNRRSSRRHSAPSPSPNRILRPPPPAAAARPPPSPAVPLSLPSPRPQPDTSVEQAAPAVVNSASETYTFTWIEDNQTGNRRHTFSKRMVHRRVCGYCKVQCASIADLQDHLRESQHAVYACCGRFFKQAEDLERHSRRRRVKHHHRVQKDG
ncbi:uncharacterized protein LAESUDRAFT_672944 [Laetiporus sulphureus 93-53]|uniref:RBR-type E3 ubiquitin transferase n=1 Tax=Laetiporus sulphureus 93-53 TaxID=1314785 RepID=A0A165GEV8_9APHY|nr:uncharacterized protein LAESUDRAFT_672944 [Laetiporus sulphureus 93-53]KZT10255.1 hypothetical protein LAESUDRAFT_672944 [Laetiporus sulphureus 93-53]